MYAGVDMSDIKTQTYSFEPVYDQNGMDFLWYKLRIEVVAVVHQAWAASHQTSAGVGDTMPYSLAYLPHILSQPRQKLYFSVGNDLVVESPPRLVNGTSMVEDCDHGPLTSAKVLQINGDTSALISFQVETYLNDCGKYMVSNRWGTQIDVDDTGYTTRTTRGRAVFRADYLSYAGLTADHFRAYLFVPADAPLKRINIHVDQSPDGCTIDYAVVDREVNYGVGNNEVLRIEGFATSGAHIEIQSLKKAIEVAGPGLIQGAFRAATTGGLSLPFDAPDAVKFVWNNLVPEGRASALVRVIGRKGADKEALAYVAMHAASSRYAPSWLLTDAIVAGAYVTQTLGDEDEPHVEVRLEFVVHHLMIAFIFQPQTIFKLMNFGVGVPTLAWSATSPTPALGGSNNSRGSYIKSLVVQALSSPCAQPPLPGTPTNYPDAASPGG